MLAGTQSHIHHPRQTTVPVPVVHHQAAVHVVQPYMLHQAAKDIITVQAVRGRMQEQQHCRQHRQAERQHVQSVQDN